MPVQNNNLNTPAKYTSSLDKIIEVESTHELLKGNSVRHAPIEGSNVFSLNQNGGVNQAENISFDFTLRVVNGEQINTIPIDLSRISKISSLRDYLAK